MGVCAKCRLNQSFPAGLQLPHLFCIIFVCLPLLFRCVFFSHAGKRFSISATSISRSSVIRKVIPYQESKLFFREVLDTMNVTFVRHSQLTVMPFPFKYLREYKDLKN